MEPTVKKWSREQCRQRYIQGERISFRKLSAISGRVESRISAWASEERWVAQRDEYQKTFQSLVQAKTMIKMSDKISDSLSDIASDNFNSLKLMRDYITFRVRLVAKKAVEIQHLPPNEQYEAAQNMIGDTTLEALSRTLQRTIGSINDTVGLRYHTEVNAAVNRVIGEGYIILDPTENDKD